MKRFRYDMNHNTFSGLPAPEHPQIEIRKVFPNARNFEPFPIGDCWTFETEDEVVPLPPQFRELTRKRSPAAIITTKQVAEHYDAATGIPGWTAKVVEGHFELAPPPGYVIATGEDGTQRVLRFDASKFGIQVSQTAGDSTPSERRMPFFDPGPSRYDRPPEDGS